MYISLLDYLEEIKKKFYVIILMIVLFLIISLGYKFHKNNYYELTFSKNLQKLSMLKLSQYNFNSSPTEAIEWIGDEATKKFNDKNKSENLILECKNNNNNIKCEISGQIKSDVDLNEVENKMYLAIFGAFEDYRIYVLKLIDEIIISRENLFNFVENSEDSNVEVKAQYKTAITEVVFVKNMFLELMNRVTLVEDEIKIVKIDTKFNYILIILSGLFSGLFLIFLQMTGKKN